MKIYVATHKEFKLPDEKGYTPLLVGAYKNINNVDTSAIEQYTQDNVGDNISEKNSNYCELTGLYWMWKNTDSDTIGLVHYRRYFTKMWSKKLLNRGEIKALLKTGDIILPEKYHLRKDTVWSDYASRHSDEELNMCKEIIAESWPEYMESFDNVFQGKSFYTFNMFISSKEKFDEYCMWLFDILFKIEEKIDISERDAYNQRMFGFLSERLFNVWIMKNDLKVVEVTVKNTESGNAKEYIKNKVKKLLNSR